jgi:hypothetical protein
LTFRPVNAILPSGGGNQKGETMRSFFLKLSHVFAAGCFGGLVNSVVVWIFGQYHIMSLFGVKLAPSFSLPWLYPRIVWGGIWGGLFFLPLRGGSSIKTGLLLSLGPTLVQLLLVFPYQAHQGLMGMKLGTLTPLFVLVFNAFWGVAAALWLKTARG